MARRRPVVPQVTVGGRTPRTIDVAQPAAPTRNPDVAAARPPRVTSTPARAPRTATGSRRQRATLPPAVELFGPVRAPSTPPIRTSQVNRGQVLPPAPNPRTMRLPVAQRPPVVPDGLAGRGSEYDDERERRAQLARQANQRGRGDNVRGYVEPGLPLELPRTFGSVPQWDDPAMREQVVQQAEQEYAVTQQPTAPYVFPQVSPTKTSNPLRPRTLESGWEETRPGYGTLRIRWRDGSGTEYYDVEKKVWQACKRTVSPGRFVNRVLNNYQYARGNF